MYLLTEAWGSRFATGYGSSTGIVGPWGLWTVTAVITLSFIDAAL